MTVAVASVWEKQFSSVLEFKLIVMLSVVPMDCLCGCDNYYCHCKNW